MFNMRTGADFSLPEPGDAEALIPILVHHDQADAIRELLAPILTAERNLGGMGFEFIIPAAARDEAQQCLDDAQ